MQNMPIHLRSYRPDDALACLDLFRDCVHRVNIRDYTPQQIHAWASPQIDASGWASRFRDRFAYVVVENAPGSEVERIVGFADMTRLGHLDRLFVSADHQGRGIARRLVESLFDDAAQNGIAQITTDASITAKPFFQRMGFRVVREQTVECRGEQLTNFRMQRGNQA